MLLLLPWIRVRAVVDRMKMMMMEDMMAVVCPATTSWRVGDGAWVRFERAVLLMEKLLLQLSAVKAVTEAPFLLLQRAAAGGLVDMTVRCLPALTTEEAADVVSLEILMAWRIRVLLGRIHGPG